MIVRKILTDNDSKSELLLIPILNNNLIPSDEKLHSNYCRTLGINILVMSLLYLFFPLVKIWPVEAK